MSALASPDPWWLAPLPDAAQAGLSSAQAATRLAEAGPNVMREGHARSLLLQYLTRFKNPLVIILLAASAVSAATGELLNFVIVSVIVLLSVTLDFFQEYRANAAADALRACSRPTTSSSSKPC
jgi:Mg2+-importing ATPase